METKFGLSVTISPEEENTLRQAESILEKICQAFEEYGQCELCPLGNLCSRLDNTMLPQTVICVAADALTVEGEG